MTTDGVTLNDVSPLCQQGKFFRALEIAWGSDSHPLPWLRHELQDQCPVWELLEKGLRQGLDPTSPDRQDNILTWRKGDIPSCFWVDDEAHDGKTNELSLQRKVLAYAFLTCAAGLIRWRQRSSPSTIDLKSMADELDKYNCRLFDEGRAPSLPLLSEIVERLSPDGAKDIPKPRVVLTSDDRYGSGTVVSGGKGLTVKPKWQLLDAKDSPEPVKGRLVPSLDIALLLRSQDFFMDGEENARLATHLADPDCQYGVRWELVWDATDHPSLPLTGPSLGLAFTIGLRQLLARQRAREAAAHE